MKLRRIFGIVAIAIWATLWPHTYGYDAHTWWLRLGADLLLTFRALFIGYGAALIILAPVLLAPRNADQRPFPTVPQAMRMLYRAMRNHEEPHW